jgi:hypothetical protein
MEAMLKAYMVAALWSTNDESDDRGGEPLDSNYDTDDIHPDTVAKMRADVEKFLADNAADIGDREEQAGHDLWMTRNGHGVGFWETPDWPAEPGERLTRAAKAMGEAYLYVGDDGMIHA